MKKCPICNQYNYKHNGFHMRYECQNEQCKHIETESEKEKDIKKFKSNLKNNHMTY